MPDGPFETWNPARRVGHIAEDMRTTDPTTPELPVIMEEWASQLDGLVDDLTERDRRAVALAERPPACGARPALGREPCDRPKGHNGDHGFMAATYAAQVRELDGLVSEVPKLRRALAEEWERGTRDAKEIGSLRLQAKMLRGIRERRRAKREARRG